MSYDFWDSFWGFATIILGILAAVAVLVFVIVGGIATPISKHYDKASCHAFGDSANREVKFVTYTYWSWDCLTPTADNKWISVKLLREFTNEAP